MGHGNAWGWGPGEPANPHVIMPEDTWQDFGDLKENTFKCDNCLSCGEDEKGEKTACCGCVNLNLMFPEYEDIPECDTCNQDNTVDGDWPGEATSLTLTEEDERDLNRAVGLKDDGSDPDLEERTPGKATQIEKKVKACHVQGQAPFSVGGDYRYPAFPASPYSAWDGIEMGKWDSISRYWGNNSNSCSDWKTVAKQPHDQVWVGGSSGLRQIRDKYQSTHHLFLPFPPIGQLADAAVPLSRACF